MATSMTTFPGILAVRRLTVPDLRACLLRTAPIGCHTVAEDLLCAVKYSLLPAVDSDPMPATFYFVVCHASNANV